NRCAVVLSTLLETRIQRARPGSWNLFRQRNFRRRQADGRSRAARRGRDRRLRYAAGGKLEEVPERIAVVGRGKGGRSAAVSIFRGLSSRTRSRAKEAAAGAHELCVVSGRYGESIAGTGSAVSGGAGGLVRRGDRRGGGAGCLGTRISRLSRD